MSAQSKAQQKAAGAALAAKRDKSQASILQGASKDMFDSMSQARLEDLAATSRKTCRTEKIMRMRDALGLRNRWPGNARRAGRMQGIAPSANQK